MLRAADECGEGARFIEVGPGKVLAGLVKRIVPGAAALSLGTAEEIRNFLEDAQ
jgi:malonyl CoA-acyl carrier protein transacylase